MNKEELIKKVKALAERGEGGEKLNAQKMLAELMKKYNIKEEDIAEDIVKEFTIKIPSVFKSMALASQIVFSVLGREVDEDKGLYTYGNRRNKAIVRSTSAEFLEIEAKFKFYLHHYKIELERFYGAFVQANELFPPPEKARKEKQKFFLTEEDMKMLKMAESLETHRYLLQIEGGENGSSK